MVDLTQEHSKAEELKKAQKLKRYQDKIRNQYKYLKDVTPKYFQAEYAKAQAEEICKYLTEIQLTPLNPWYTQLFELISSGQFMSQFYLTFNEFDVIVPDYEKISTLVLKDPDPEEFPRTIQIA